MEADSFCCSLLHRLTIALPVNNNLIVKNKRYRFKVVAECGNVLEPGKELSFDVYTNIIAMRKAFHTITFC